MKTTMNKYIYDHDGEELAVLCQVELPRDKHLEVAKNEAIKKYGSFDEHKLIYKGATTITGTIKDSKFIEEK